MVGRGTTICLQTWKIHFWRHNIATAAVLESTVTASVTITVEHTVGSTQRTAFPYVTPFAFDKPQPYAQLRDRSANEDAWNWLLVPFVGHWISAMNLGYHRIEAFSKLDDKRQGPHSETPSLWLWRITRVVTMSVNKGSSRCFRDAEEMHSITLN